jgi:dTDP-4-dehydrorhamnose reductase
VILLTGATGLLGKYFLENWKSPQKIICISRKEKNKTQIEERIQWECGDLSDLQFMEKIYSKYQPSITIHAGGEGGVDLVERNPSIGEVEIKGTSQNISDLCTHYKTKLIYVSSNAVFGNVNQPLSDWDQYSPINKYGEYKVEVEKFIRMKNKDFVIVRPIVMYGINNLNQRDNPLTLWIKKLSNRESIKVVEDVYTQPLYADTCAKSIIRSIDLDFSGIYNISGGETITLYDFAIKIANTFGFDPTLVKPISSSELINLAPRPKRHEYLMETCNSKLGLEIQGLGSNLQEIKGLLNK